MLCYLIIIDITLISDYFFSSPEVKKISHKHFGDLLSENKIFILIGNTNRKKHD